MTRIFPREILSLALLFCASPALSQELDNIRIDAVKAAYQDAFALTGQDRLVLLREWRDTLETILDEYPSSQAARDILLRREVGGLNFGEMDRLLFEALGSRPLPFAAADAVPSDPATTETDGAARAGSEVRPDVPPISQAQNSGRAETGSEAPDNAGSAALSSGAAPPVAIPNFFGGAASPEDRSRTSPSAQTVPGEAGVAAMPQSTEEARPQEQQFFQATESSERQLDLSRQDIREVQARLTAIGIDPNGIDGVAGRGTRNALRAWQQTAGLPPTGYLNEQQLTVLRSGSQSAYDAWLSNPQNRARVEVVAITPARMIGSWRFVARCGRGSRLPGQTITGIMAMEHAGGSNYRGRVRNSQGLIGAVSGRITGRTIVTVIDWGLFFGRVQMRGRVSDDARSVNGQDSNGCRVTVTKT